VLDVERHSCKTGIREPFAQELEAAIQDARSVCLAGSKAHVESPVRPSHEAHDEWAQVRWLELHV